MTTEIENKAQLLEEAILADKALVEELAMAESTGEVWSLEDFIARAKAKWN